MKAGLGHRKIVHAGGVTTLAPAGTKALLLHGGRMSPVHDRTALSCLYSMGSAQLHFAVGVAFFPGSEDLGNACLTPLRFLQFILVARYSFVPFPKRVVLASCFLSNPKRVVVITLLVYP